MTLSTWEFLTRQRDSISSMLAVVALCIAAGVRAAPARLRSWILIAFLLLVAGIAFGGLR